MTAEEMAKMNQLKIEIFDIIVEQEQCQIRFNQLEQIKTPKVQELNKLKAKLIEPKKE